MPEYFDRYINLAEDAALISSLQISLSEINNWPLDVWEKIGDRIYAPDKWTIKDIVQHVIDTERIFSYRALAFSRNETQPLPSYDEDTYARAGRAVNRKLSNIIDELKIVRLGTIALFNSFDNEMLEKTGMGFKGPYSVASLGFMLAGHQRWHMHIIDERYLPLLKALSK
ncbi:MAG: DinB family protein [Bacteroidetes bacterium]|nr:DinB family protein [Bacteroidota bacterium]